MKPFCLLLAVLLFFGCATAADIRNKIPFQIIYSDKSPKILADCMMYRAPAEVTCGAVPYYHFALSEEPPGTFHVLAEIPGQPMGEASFIPFLNGGTQIEVRARWNFWGKNSFWECIQNCASHEQTSQNIPGK